MEIVNLAWAKEFFEEMHPTYALYDEYYDGKHSVLMSEEMAKTPFGRLLKKTRDNLMPVVVDTMVDRLSLLGFTSTDNAAKKVLNDIWKRQRMASKSITIHHHTQLYGDAYVLVWPADNGKPTLYPQTFGTIAIKYDYSQEEPIVAEAVKAWTETIYDQSASATPYNKKTRLRVTIYRANDILRFYQDFGLDSFNWSMFPFTTEAMTEVPDSSTLRNPYGQVPMFRFFAGKDQTKFGMSSIKDAIPIQDGLNKTLRDLMMASEFQGFAQRWLTGVDIPKDPDTGLSIEPFKNSMDRIWAISSPEAKFGQFSAGDLVQLIEELDNFRHEIARITRTPAHLFLLNTGDFPSGEALRTAEAPLLSKVGSTQEFNGDVWEDVMKFAYRIATNTDAEDLDVDAIWKNTMQYTEKEFLETEVLKLQIGVSEEQLMKEAGYSDEQIAEMVKAKEEKAAKEDAKALKLAQASKPEEKPTESVTKE